VAKQKVEQGEHVVQKAGPSGYAEPRERESAGHRDAGQLYVERQKRDRDEKQRKGTSSSS
jgi:hypothetical protein